MEARKNAPAQVPTNFESVDPNEWMKHQQAVVGPTMVFAKLNHTMKNGKKLKKADTEDFAFMWKELLFLGGVNVTSYAIEFDTVLMTTAPCSSYFGFYFNLVLLSWPLSRFSAIALLMAGTEGRKLFFGEK